jgi:hypothetical protein
MLQPFGARADTPSLEMATSAANDSIGAALVFRCTASGVLIGWRSVAFHLDLLGSPNSYVSPHRRRSPLATHIYHSHLMAFWKAVTVAVA